jgi:hypothetical protein
MPDNDLIDSGAQCIKAADHGRIHVIALTTRGAVTFWRVNTRKRTVRMVMHADLRDGSIPTEEECMALYHSLRSLKSS